MKALYLNDPPNSFYYSHLLADYIEYECIKSDGSCSRQFIARALMRPADNDYSAKRDDDDMDIEVQSIVDDALSTISSRETSLGNKYPFKLENGGNTIALSSDAPTPFIYCYLFLLYTSRLRMAGKQSMAVCEDIDATQVFEELCARVLQNYLGERANAFVFGTGADIEVTPNFPDKLEDLRQRLNLSSLLNPMAVEAAVARKRKDARLDVVGWSSFSDSCESMLVAFGQCKTGQSYDFEGDSMNPSAFLGSYFRDSPAIETIRTFFVAEAIDPSTEDWRIASRHAGIIFDRLRILDFLDESIGAKLGEISIWVDSQNTALGLKLIGELTHS